MDSGPAAGHLGRVEAEVARHDGMVVETVGEMLVAVFGVPRTREDDSERAVRTASSEQVRRPINREGLDQWKPYEPWLDPLKAALGPVLEDWM